MNKPWLYFANLFYKDTKCWTLHLWEYYFPSFLSSVRVYSFACFFNVSFNICEDHLETLVTESEEFLVVFHFFFFFFFLNHSSRWRLCFKVWVNWETLNVPLGWDITPTHGQKKHIDVILIGDQIVLSPQASGYLVCSILN